MSGLSVRFASTALLWLALACAPAAANDAETLEARVAEIERLGVTAHWSESNSKIEALARQKALTPGQRDRIEYVRLRNQGLAGDQPGALQGLSALLEKELPAELRLRVYATAISIAANLEQWPLAFSWLSDGLAYLPEAPGQSAALLGIASYLHTVVGDTEKGRELGLRELRQVEAAGDLRGICQALGSVALAADHAREYAEAERWRHRQIEACRLADDPVFTAVAKYGIGKMAVAQGRYDEGLKWGRESLAALHAAGFNAGTWSANLVIADSLIATNRGLDEAERLLIDTLAYYRAQESDFAVAETENLLARLAERRGDIGSGYEHLKQAASAAEAAERKARERRLAYLQVQFDIRSKEQQIALLESEKQLAALQATADKRRQWLLAMGIGALLVTAILLAVLLRRTFLERRRYRWQSERDSLTRLYNYQQVRKRGGSAFARARQTGQPFTAIVADIDRFKQVNDRYGHAAGDEALRSFGVWINEVIRARDIAGRSGGDEFTILVEADASQAQELVQRLRSRIRPITVFGDTFSFNISSGICQTDADTTTLEELIHRADQALYRAKYEGRDRVVLATQRDAGMPANAGLVVVGSGIQFGRHASERCLSEIREAQVVFCLADPFALAMVRDLRPDAINLGTHYGQGKDRRQTYREIDDAIMAEVRAGKKVCAVFYGHPGVFADVPHRVIGKARAEGIPARMEPGISAEACLYADVGMDPGHRGVQSMEATQFLVYDRTPDTDGVVLLWQVALSGDLTCTRMHAEREGVQALVDKLLRWYPAEHEVILYEAAQLPIQSPRIERLALRDLPDAHYEEYTTLVIPPLGVLRESQPAQDLERTA